MPAVHRDGPDLVLELRVQPRSTQTALAGLHGDRVRVRLNAPPVDGRANAALVEFLAAQFGVPRASIVIEHGLAGRDKRVRIRGAADIPVALQTILEPDRGTT